MKFPENLLFGGSSKIFANRKGLDTYLSVEGHRVVTFGIDTPCNRLCLLVINLLTRILFRLTENTNFSVRHGNKRRIYGDMSLSLGYRHDTINQKELLGAT